MASTDMVSIFTPEDGYDLVEAFGPYEVYATECGQTVPVAMLLPTSEGEPCTACRYRLGIMRPTTGPQRVQLEQRKAISTSDHGSTSNLSADNFAFFC